MLLVPMVGSSLLLPGLLGGCRPPATERRPTPLVSSEAVAVSAFSDSVDLVATLEAEEEVELAAQAGGRILNLLVRQGERVRKGQLLLVLDQTQARAEVARLAAEVETNRLNYQRYEYLVKQGAASAFQRDEFRQRYISAREDLIARRADLAFRDLVAPIDGTVGDLRVKQGDVLAAGTPFTTIVRNDRLAARLEVPAVLSDRLRLGQSVTVMDPAASRPLASGTVVSIDPAVAPGSQTVLVKAAITNADGRLRNGLRTRVRLLLDRRAQPSVPFVAVTRLAGQSFVFEVGDLAALERRPGRADLAKLRRLPPGTPLALQTPVVLGDLQGERYPVVRGLGAGARVITSNLLNLRHGSPVRLE